MHRSQFSAPGHAFNRTNGVKRTARLLMVTLTSALFSTSTFADVLITNAMVYDGTGRSPFAADIRVRGDRITDVAPRLHALPGETVHEAHGLALAPGFIDMHSHGNRGLLEDPNAATVTRQGVTTIVVGQDGESDYPLRDWYAQLEATPPAINVASMVGHTTLRLQVMGETPHRPSTNLELAAMKSLLAKELAAGAFGLSTGLEYEAAHSSTTEEIVELSKIAGAAGGFYISHVRDEGNRVFDSYDEVLRIGREARIPVVISHIKLGSTPVWHQAARRMPGYFDQARREKIDLGADVYPYTFWQSTIRVILPDRDYFNPQKVARAIADNGGPAAFRIGKFAPEPALAGRTLQEVSATWSVTPVEAFMRIVRATEDMVDGDGSPEDVLVTSISEDDLRWFIAHPDVMYCSDGELHGSHPRGAGAFPRVLGRYVREEKLIPLAEAIRKMSGLPAERLGLKDRGAILAGHVADLVLFDPDVVIDRSSVWSPEEPPLGIIDVMVAGEWVVRDTKVTGAHPGRVLRSSAHQP